MNRIMKKNYWKNIPGYEDYQGSNYGDIKLLNYRETGNERIMKSNLRKDGYYQIGLMKDGKQKMFKVHQLIAMAFLGHVPDGHNLVVNHINGIKNDNRVENLEIVTQRDNVSTRVRKDRNTMSSQLPGASWAKRDKKWISQYRYKGKKYHIGFFNTDIEASEKWKEAYEADKNGEFEIFNSQFKRCNMSGVNQYTKDDEFIKEWKSASEAGKELNINQGHICSCCSGKRKSTGGFLWKYKEY